MNTSEMRKQAALSTVALAALLAAMPALAQTGSASIQASGGPSSANAKASPTDPATNTGDIVVTARKGGAAESAQKIPESIRAIGSKEIEAAGITRLQDAVLLTPNIVINPGYRMGVVNLSSRGHSTPQQGDAPMVINFDGVQAPAQDFLNQDLFDIDRIEILKGPQPLYGAGAIAGAINVITAPPTNDYQGFIKATYGNGNATRVVAGFSGPIIQDKLFFRIAGVDTSRDGLINNTLTGGAVDFLREKSIRASLLGVFGSLRVTLTGGYTDTPRAGASYFDSIPLKPDTVPQIDSLFGGPLGRLGSNISNANFENSSGTPVVERRQLGNVSLKADYDIAGGTLTSVTGYNKSTQSDFGDLDFQPADTLLQNVRYDVSVFNQELRFASNPNAPLRYLVGAFYQHRKIYNQVIVLLGNFKTAYLPVQEAENDPANAVLTDGRDDVSSNGYGAFVNIDYDFNDRLTFNGVLRYDLVDYSTKYVGANLTYLALPLADASTSFHQIQPKANLSYKFSSTVLGYVDYARGFKTGVPNPTPAYAAGYARFIKPETSDEFEVGIKSSLLDRRLQLNVDGFYSKIYNRQHYFYGAALQSQVNYGLARVYGVEASISALLAPGLTFDASGGIMSAKIASDQITQYDNYMTGVVALTVNSKGNVLPDTPERTFNAALSYRKPISDTLDVTGRVAYRYESRIYFDTENEISDTGNKNFVDLRLGLENKRPNWTASLFMDNATNERTFTNYAYSGGQGNYLPNQPRTYGIELGYKF